MTDLSTVLRRKLAPSRPAAAPGGSSIEALLRKVMPRIADETLSLDMSVGAVGLEMKDKAAVLAALGPHDLTYVLKSESGARGLCRVSPPVLAALIEVQVSGHVSRATAPERAPTRTDGIVAADMIDAWMKAVSEAAAAEGLADLLPIAGFARLNGIVDRRNADLALDPGSYRLLSVELSLGGDAKSGALVFAAPEPVKQGEAAPSRAAERMAGHLKGIAAPMQAVLARLPQPIERVRALKPGDVLAVPVTALVGVRLEAGNGRLIATARLGQLNGMKAVRLTRPGTRGGAALAAPQAAGLPAMAGGAGLAAMGAEMPDLPDLPDLPELPDLPPID